MHSNVKHEVIHWGRLQQLVEISCNELLVIKLMSQYLSVICNCIQTITVVLVATRS